MKITITYLDDDEEFQAKFAKDFQEALDQCFDENGEMISDPEFDNMWKKKQVIPDEN